MVLSWKFKLEQVPLSPLQYTYEAGMAFLPNIGGGISLPRRYCIPTSPAQTIHDVSYCNSVILAPEKRGLFPLAIFVDSIADIPDAMKILLAIEPRPEDIGQAINEATYISSNIQLREKFGQ